ncbi:MAG TPA: AMP-binding protein [Conexibacter sp.]|nr:AMP-binding protein [Conexibacter sp.]
MAIIDFFDRGVALDPGAPCLTEGARTLSHAQADAWSHRIAGALARDGVGDGARVAVLTPNCANGFLAMLGIWRAGAAWLPLNARNSLFANRDVVAHAEPAALFFHSDHVEQAFALRDAVPALRLLVCVDRELEQAPELLTWAADGPARFATPPRGPESLAVLMSTGGTTGQPKAVMLPDRSFDAMAANFLHAMPASDEQRPVHLIAAPMTHGAGFCAIPLMAAGAHHVLLPAFEIGDLLAAIARHAVTHVFFPPTVIYSMLSHARVREHDYGSLRHMIYAAAPMSVEKLREAIDVFGPVMSQVFGQAEAPLTCTALTPAAHRVDPDGPHARRLWSCGRRTLLTPVAVMDDDGRLLAPGERGELVVRGPLVMAGYYRDEAATARTSTNGWHRTGDIGEIDDDGYVYIVDRKRDMVITGGFNVYPSEVEQVLWAHPAVQDCVVIGAPDPKWGEAVTAVVELKDGHAAEETELIAFCRERLGGVKTPKRVQVWDELPRSAVGKVLKRDVRETFWVGRERAV